jgi:GntR family transcriptional regulator
MGGSMKDPGGLFKINRNSKLPLYSLIEENFRELILSGQINPGDAVPSEWELSEIYQVSRLTVRHALDNLARQGWLNRRHGVCTFVANPTVARIAPSKLSFTEQMRAIGRTPSSRQIRFQIVTANSEIASHLGIQEGDPVVEITRLRLADDEPILLETSYLSQVRFPELDETVDLSNNSLYEHLNTQYRANISSMDQTLEPVLLTEAEAKYLGTQAGTPAVLSEITAFSSDGQPVEYCWSVTRGDKCKFYLRFRRGENNL